LHLGLNCPPLPAAVVRRGNGRLLHRAGSRRAGARVRLFRGRARPAATPPKLHSRYVWRCRLRPSDAGRSDAYLVGSGGDSAISLSLRVVRFEQTHVDNARQISRLMEWSGQAIMTVPKNDKFKDYARYAELCLNMVAATRDQELRCIQREMAAEWLRLADTVRRPRRSKQMQMG
jgi:hypothetical protein